MQNAERFSVFHAKEIRSRHREYADWDEVKTARVIYGLTTLVKNELTEGVCIYLPYEQYDLEYRGSFNPKGVGLDSQYGVCFRMILRNIINLIYATGKRHKLHVVVERGHPNAKNTEKIFHESKLTLKARGIELLGDFTLAAKEEAAPLMAADFLAHTYALMRR